ncbi:MAG: hypothetical protein R3250_02355 [Melioribacteraceae bacterium]|nr:hypothetical protein [Melioribacteraceae bacterium]
MKRTSLVILLGLATILSACSNAIPETEIISEPPFITGHIVEIIEDKQVIGIIEDSSKQEALNYDKQSNSNVLHFYSNGTKIVGEFSIGNKVAIWKNSVGPENTGEIATAIVVLEE